MTNKLEKLVSVRLSKDDHNQLAAESERLGTTVAEVIRKSCVFYLQHQRFEHHLITMERRQSEVLIEVVAAMLGLNEQRKIDVIEQLLEKGVNI